MTVELQLKQQISTKKFLKLAAGQSEAELNIQGWRLSANSKMLSYGPCLTAPGKSECPKCIWVELLLMLGHVAWRCLHRLLTTFWKVPCVQQCRTWKQYWHKAEHWNIDIEFLSIHDKTFWIFLAALPPFAPCLWDPVPSHLPLWAPV